MDSDRGPVKKKENTLKWFMMMMVTLDQTQSGAGIKQTTCSLVDGAKAGYGYST